MSMEFQLEVVPVPVSDVNRAKRSYSEQLGFVVDIDTRLSDETRLVQLTPPGSACSIHLNSALDLPPGVLKGLQLMVSDIEAARAELVERGVEASPVQHIEDKGVWVEGRGGDWNSFVFFSDPDGNGWVLQERPSRN